MRIVIEKQPQTVMLLRLLLGLVMLLGVLEWSPVLAPVGKLMLDILWLVLLVYLLRFSRDAFHQTMWSFAGWIGSFFLLTILTAVVQWQKPWFCLWALRNNFRFYVVFLAAGAFFRKRDIGGLFRVLEWLFWLNIPVTLVQFFAFDIRGDLLGGIFGTVSGVNGDTNLFFAVVITHSILKFLERKEGMWRCFGKCAAALVLAAMAELKFFFVLFLVIVLLTVLGTEVSWRKAGLVLGGITGAAVGAVILTRLFPRFNGWFSLTWLWKTAASAVGYTASGDLNRLNAISTINRLFFTDWPQRIFGFGLGACDTSSISFLNTPFYMTNGWLHYNWMSHSFWYLEMGWTGLFFFFGFFLLVFGKADAGFCGRQSRILSVCCLLIGVYNASLRTEMANLVYTVLALPFVRRE